MAVYTQVNDKALDEFLQNYTIGYATSLKGIAEGVENSNYFLETSGGKFILTLYERRVSAKDLPYFLDLMAFTASKGLPAAGVRSQKSGKRLGTLAGRPAAIIDFLPGLSTHTPSGVHAKAAARILGKFHQVTEDFSAKRSNPLSLSGWKKMAGQIGQDADKCSPKLSLLIDEELNYLATHWPKNIRRGTTHSDLFPDNILFQGDTVSGIIDFYFASDDFLAYDLAVMINSWCFGESQQINHDHVEALIQGYEDQNGLPDTEKQVLPLLMRGSALRFLLTRLYDWLNQQQNALVKVKDPMDYVRILDCHRHRKTLSDYGL